MSTVVAPKPPGSRASVSAPLPRTARRRVPHSQREVLLERG